jgi:rubrerythrin
MVEQAIREGHKAKTMLDWANRVEKVHAKLFGEALAALQSGQDLAKMEVYLCPVCGDLEFGVPEKCPVCGAPGAKFERVA